MFLPWREIPFSTKDKSFNVPFSDRLQDGLLAQMDHSNFAPSRMPPIRTASTPIPHAQDRSNYFGGLFAFNTLARRVLHMLPGLQDPGSEHYLLVLRTLRSPKTCARILQATGIYAGPFLGIEAEVLMRYFGMYMAANGEEGFTHLTPWFVHAYQPLAFVLSQQIMNELALMSLITPRPKKNLVSVVRKEPGEPSTSKGKENQDPAANTEIGRRASVSRKASVKAQRHAPYLTPATRPIQVVAQYPRLSFFPSVPLHPIRSGPPPAFPGPLICPPAPCPEFSKAERIKLLASFDPLTPIASESSILHYSGPSSPVDHAHALYASMPDSLRQICHSPPAVEQHAITEIEASQPIHPHPAATLSNLQRGM